MHLLLSVTPERAFMFGALQGAECNSPLQQAGNQAATVQGRLGPTVALPTSLNSSGWSLHSCHTQHQAVVPLKLPDSPFYHSQAPCSTSFPQPRGRGGLAWAGGTRRRRLLLSHF